MRTSTTVTCPSCDAAWGADDARFCGACGARLQPSAPSEPAPDRPWFRLALGLVAVAVVVGGALALNGVSSFRLPPREADPAVELDEDELALEGEPLSDAEREEALAPFDPDRLRCEPEGCERWRVALPEGPPTSMRADVVDDLVVVAGDGVRAHDLDSGEERWHATWPDAADPPPTNADMVLVESADGVVVATWPTSGHVHALDTEGRTLWHAIEATGGGFISPHGDVVVASRSSGEEIEITSETDGQETTAFMVLSDLRVLDTATGALLWEAEAVGVRGVSDDAFLVTDGTTTRLLDARTGAERARRELPLTGSLQLTDEVVLHQQDGEDGTWMLRSRPSLEVVAELGPLASLRPVEGAAALVGQIVGEGDDRDRIVLYETDGTVRWERELSAPAGSLPRCCANPQVEGDDLVLPPLPGTSAPLRLALADGTLRDTSPVEPDAIPAPTGGRETIWLSPHTALRSDETDDRRSRIWHDGHRIDIRGRFSWPLNSEPPFILADETSLVAVQPVPRD